MSRPFISSRATTVSGVTFALLVLLAATATAHDFWLVPDAFQIAEGGPLEVRGQTSSRFPTSEAAVAVDRVSEARIIGTAGEARITDLTHRGKSLLLRHRPSAAGQYVISAALSWRSVRESSPGFRRYLELEGAPEALARVDRDGLLRGRDSVTRRYAKYAKTLVQVGVGGGRAFSRVAGHPLEFVPLSDPASLRVGDTLTLRALFLGRPTADIRAHAGAVEWPIDESAEPSAAGDRHFSSDATGTLRVPIARAGLWNVRTIHIVPSAPGSGADWDTHWATIVFHVRGVSAGPSQGSDSAAAIAVVQRFHGALAGGDSLGALALMTDDAIVLESGGVETRAEYRAHHLPADIEFARAVPSERTVRRVSVRGDVAWVSSTSSARGTFRGRQMNSDGAELAILVRTPAGWRISAVHWSSRARRG